MVARKGINQRNATKFGVIYFPNLGLFVMVGQIPGRQGPILQTTCQLFIANPSIYHADSFSCLSIARSPSCFPFPMPFPSAFNACLDSRDIDLYICKQISARARGGSRLTWRLTCDEMKSLLRKKKPSKAPWQVGLGLLYCNQLKGSPAPLDPCLTSA